MKKGTLIIVLGLLLIAAALCLIGYNLWDNNRAGEESQQVLDVLEEELDFPSVPTEGNVSDPFSGTEQDLSEDEALYPPYVLDPYMEMPVLQVKGNDYVGILYIPSIGCKLPVMNKWSYPSLKISPCRYAGSAYLNNMVICAHNYRRHFGNLKELHYDDTIVFTDMDGNVFTYKVMEIETLRPRAVEEMAAGDWDLTLFTCTTGGATRVTVRCKLK